MKNSIGSLAALAALIVPAVAEAAVQTAADGVQTINYAGTINYDFDGDAATDFSLFANFGASAFGVTHYANFGQVSFGQEFFHYDLANYGETLPLTTASTGYYGFAFEVAGQTHVGWAHFVFDDLSDTLQVQSAAWQDVAYASITAGAGAIPEPSAAGALAGAGALMGAVALRRRRRSS
ncbi:MAG: PEP-CTERM sorting domain-containing protein [Verrucomicrobiota bacterium]